MKNDIIYKKISRIPLRYIPIMTLASISINILSLALPLTMKQIYSNIIISKSIETLTWLMLGCIITLMLEVLIRKIKDSSSKWISAKYENQLSTYLMQKILNSFETDFERSSYNTNIEKFNSVARVTAFYSTSFFQLFIDLPFMIFFLYLIFYIGGYLVVIPIALATIYIILMIINSKYYFKNKEIQIETSDKLMTQLSETLEKIHLVKSAGLEDFQISKYKKALKDTTEAEFKTNTFQMIPQSIAAYISQITLFSILMGGSYLMIVGKISFGDITACSLLGGRAIAPIQSLMNSYLQSKDIKLLKGRLDNIALKPDQYCEDTPLFPEDIDGMIEIINLKYNNVQNNMQETLSCKISSGSFVCINPIEFLSYGKVLLKIIGKEKIEGGKILIDNLDITEWNMSSLKGKIEYITDSVNIYKGTVMENITYFDTSKNQDAYEAAALVGLDILVNQMPEGFETSLEIEATNYLTSTFMQRLNLTRALLVRPRVLLLDRIDESMDNETLGVFISLLEKLKGKITILVATDNSIIEGMADRILSND